MNCLPEAAALVQLHGGQFGGLVVRCDGLTVVLVVGGLGGNVGLRVVVLGVGRI